jgi:GTPase
LKTYYQSFFLPHFFKFSFFFETLQILILILSKKSFYFNKMKWRLQEGLGEAIYEIGVNDNGHLYGLNEEDMEKSLETLKKMATRLGASVSIIRERKVANLKKAAEVLIRKVPEDSQFIDIRIAVLGNVESGKSTLVSVLTHGELDNGSGRARLNLFRHPHEIQTGRTSSINNEIMGFDNMGYVQNFSNCRQGILLKLSIFIIFIC